VPGFLTQQSTSGCPAKYAHIFRRSSDLQAVSFAELYHFLEPGQPLDSSATDSRLGRLWQQSNSQSWNQSMER